jgi:hypothetical protein
MKKVYNQKLFPKIFCKAVICCFLWKTLKPKRNEKSVQSKNFSKNDNKNTFDFTTSA